VDFVDLELVASLREVDADAATDDHLGADFGKCRQPLHGAAPHHAAQDRAGVLEVDVQVA